VPRRYALALAALAAILLAPGCELRLPAFHAANRPPRAVVSPPGPLAPQIPDSPSRALRISYLQGTVSFQAAGTKGWSRAELNRPIGEGDALWTDVADRAELHLGSAVIRMDARSSLEVLKFDDHVIQAKVTQGVIGVTVRQLAPGEAFEIDTPNAAVTFLQAGKYRLDIQPDMDTTFVTVRTGDAEVSGTHLDFNAHAGQRVNVSGPDATEYGVAGAAAPDTFDELCEMRDSREDRSVSAKYVAPDTIGDYDLDDFGAWREDADRGPIWTPRGLAAGWAPYRFGHWTWVEPWGWTWIDDAAWGFAPFHYGRWIFLDSVWSWIPGPRQVRPVYAPALVVFAGGGRPGFHYFFWIGRAGVAWFPLGPGEAYVPPYRCSPAYLTNINGGADLSRRSYANQSVDGAVTAVPRETFVRGQLIADAAVPVSKREAALALVNGTEPPVAPVEESLAPRRDRFVLPPPERSQSTAVLGHREAAPRPLAFRLRKPVLDAHPGRPLESSEWENLRQAAGKSPRSDVRPARLGAMGTEPVAPPLLARTPEEERRQQTADSQRLRAIESEMRRGQQASVKAGH
jgi:hypothetical protein